MNTEQNLKTKEGTLWNDPFMPSKHNWIFTEIATNEKYLVDESQTEELNALALEVPMFYAGVYMNATKTDNPRKVRMFIGNENTPYKVLVGQRLGFTSSVIPHGNNKFPVWFEENRTAEFIDKSQVGVLKSKKLKMDLYSKSEWFVLERPFGEPEVTWKTSNQYQIERRVNPDGVIVWYGHAINWKKEPNGVWTELATNEDAKPLEKYLPEVVYGEDLTYWKECDMPIYEELYLEMNNLEIK